MAYDAKGFSGFKTMSNPECKLWVDWETTRSIKDGVVGWQVRMILKASRTPGYSTYGNGNTWVAVGGQKQQLDRYVEIVGEERVYMEVYFFYSGSSLFDTTVGGEGGINIPDVAGGQVNFNISLPQNSWYVHYQSNGGINAPSSSVKQFGKTLELSYQVPTRQGYTFTKWTTNPNGTGTAYYPSGSFFGNYSMTLYANWSPNAYNISYDGNGGTGEPGPQRKVHDININISTTVPVREGHSFLRWNTSSTGTGTNYVPGALFVSNANTKLYAMWNIYTYSVSYNANGGVGSPTAQTKVYGTNLALSRDVPTRNGYTFKGWAITVGGGVAYSPGAVYTANANIVLYAVWDKNVMSVTFDANGGDVKEPIRNVYQYDKVGTLPVPTRQNYKFLGWSTIKNGTNYINSDYIVNINVTVYATWKLQANCYSKHDDVYKTGMMHSKVNGEYKTGTIMYKKNGVYVSSNM